MKQLCIKSNGYSGRSAITKLIIGALLSLSSVSAIAGESNANEDSLNSNLYPRIDSIISPIGRTYFDYDDEGGLVITRFSRESVDSAWGTADTSNYLVSDYPFLETQPFYGIDEFDFDSALIDYGLNGSDIKQQQYKRSADYCITRYQKGSCLQANSVSEEFDKEYRHTEAVIDYYMNPDGSPDKIWSHFNYTYDQSGLLNTYSKKVHGPWGNNIKCDSFEYNQYGLVEYSKDINISQGEYDIRTKQFDRTDINDTITTQFYYSLQPISYFPTKNSIAKLFISNYVYKEPTKPIEPTEPTYPDPRYPNPSIDKLVDTQPDIFLDSVVGNKFSRYYIDNAGNRTSYQDSPELHYNNYTRYQYTSYHDNGIIETSEESYEDTVTWYGGEPIRENRIYRIDYDEMGNMTTLVISSMGVFNTYENSYDKEGRLAQVIESESYYDINAGKPLIKTSKYEISYNELNLKNREIKYILDTITNSWNQIEYRNFYYTTEDTSYQFKSFLTSLFINNEKLDTFSPDQFEYDLTNTYYDGNVSFLASIGASAKQKYDSISNTLMVTVTDKNCTDSNTYHFRFKPYESYMTSLSIDGIKVDTFSSNKYNYTLQCDYNEGTFVYELSDETKVVEKVYDPETKTLTLVLQNTNNQSIQSTYTFRFNPIDGLPVVWGESVQLYVDGSTICVNDVNETVNVYDCSGILVGSDTNEQARVTVRKAGVYLVAAKGQAVKVVVK